MKKKDHYLKEVYKVDPANDAYMIEIALDEYADVFSEWDPAPFKRRELDQDLERYITDGANEIPRKFPLELCFLLPLEKRNKHEEEEVQRGIRNSFTFEMQLLKEKAKKVNLTVIRYLIMGFIFLWLGTNLAGIFANSPTLSLLGEGIFIGGWVFIWESVSLLFFTNRDLYAKLDLFKRLKAAPIVFSTLNDAATLE